MSPTLLRRPTGTRPARSVPGPRDGAAALIMRAHTGEALAFDHARWHAPADGEEHALLRMVRGPVIDLGCGPGRIVDTLARRGVPALGVDSSPSAVALARARGTAVLERDIFGPLPGEGRWATALLFDGTIGIGGDPGRLLARCRELTSSRGRVVIEVEPPGSGWRTVTAWFEREGRRSPSFEWAVVGADAMAPLARGAGLEVDDLTETPSGRWFAHLQAAA